MLHCEVLAEKEALGYARLCWRNSWEGQVRGGSVYIAEMFLTVGAETLHALKWQRDPRVC